MISGFQVASQMQQLSCLEVPESLKNYCGNLIDKIEAATITQFESNSIGIIHEHLHDLMVNAVADGWNITFVDPANCFNPQLLSTMCFEKGMNSAEVLEKISLSRPFQYFQTISTVKELVNHLQPVDPHKSLIIITNLAGMFFSPDVEQIDNLFPLPQLESYRQVAGILQSLAVQGHTFVVTNQSEIKKRIIDNIDPSHINPASLKYAAKVHIQIQVEEHQMTVRRLNHPFLPPTKRVIKLQPKVARKKVDARLHTRQRSLDSFDISIGSNSSTAFVYSSEQKSRAKRRLNVSGNASLDQFF